jgi:crossover junction endodeoxyribonuclease RusA
MQAPSAETDGNMPCVIVSLPWPPRDASPNARAHWAAVHRARARYRADARVLAIAAGARDFSMMVPDGAVLRVTLCAYPPDKRRRDWDNVVASVKAGLDGIADALGIDDSQFRLSVEMQPEAVKGGRVDVVIAHDC